MFCVSVCVFLNCTSLRFLGYHSLTSFYFQDSMPIITPLVQPHLLFTNIYTPTSLCSCTFQCLADCIGLSCTLVRGEYNRAWNEVRLFTGNPSGKELSSQPSRYIVDLMHQPGCLLAVNTLAAVRYTTI